MLETPNKGRREERRKRGKAHEGDKNCSRETKAKVAFGEEKQSTGSENNDCKRGNKERDGKEEELLSFSCSES